MGFQCGWWRQQPGARAVEESRYQARKHESNLNAYVKYERLQIFVVQKCKARNVVSDILCFASFCCRASTKAQAWVTSKCRAPVSTLIGFAGTFTPPIQPLRQSHLMAPCLQNAVLGTLPFVNAQSASSSTSYQAFHDFHSISMILPSMDTL